MKAEAKFSTALAAASSLHGELALRITRLLHDETFAAGDRLFEDRLATRLGVSRTPIRAALELLVEHGFVERQKHRGFVLVKRPPLLPPAAQPPSPHDALIVQIASDRRLRSLPDQVSEQDLMLGYGVSRGVAKSLLTRLIDVGLMERGLGRRYRFIDRVYDAKVKLEGFRFRLMVEPAILLEPGFAPAAGWIEEMRERHQAFIDGSWTRASGVAFFEMNAAFHEGLACTADNRFVVEALRRINQQRRLVNYDWWHGRDRIERSCREHIAILDAVRRKKMTLASRLMRAHLDGARLAPVRPSRSAPAEIS